MIGKEIERFFGTVKTRFTLLLKSQPPNSIDDLNRQFWQWLEEDYHRKIHASLGMSPLDMYLSQASQMRMLEDPAFLNPLFLKREKYKVKHDGAIFVNNRLYEVLHILLAIGLRSALTRMRSISIISVSSRNFLKYLSWRFMMSLIHKFLLSSFAYIIR
ncbi:MAG: hypothetical protein H0Z36_02680 [Thermosyntropha sp.]|nr:hypothetical protein [Thermosyntropha sp.]